MIIVMMGVLYIVKLWFLFSNAFIISVASEVRRSILCQYGRFRHPTYHELTSDVVTIYKRKSMKQIMNSPVHQSSDIKGRSGKTNLKEHKFDILAIANWIVNRTGDLLLN